MWSGLWIARALVYRGSVNGSVFDTRPVHVGFVVDKMAQRTYFLSNPVFPHQYYSTYDPYTCFTHLTLTLHRGHGLTRPVKPSNQVLINIYSKTCLKRTPYIPETWTNGK